MGLFSQDDANSFNDDPEVRMKRQAVAEAKKNDVRQGFGLSQDSLTQANEIGARASRAGDVYGLTEGVQSASGLLQGDNSYNQGLGMSGDDSLSKALSKRSEKGFHRQYQQIKSRADLESQNLRAKDMAMNQQHLAAQQEFGAQSMMIKKQREYAAKQQRSAVLGGILTGAGAVAGTLIAPGAGTALGGQIGGMAGSQ